jgi:hypothetical protein
MSTRIRKILMIALGLMMATVIGCGGGGETSTSEGTPGAPLPARTLSWEPPTSYVDATPMNPVTDLDRFEIHVNETGTFTDKDVPMAELGAVDPKTLDLTTSFNLANVGSPLTVGPHYFVSLRAVALTGLKSDFSPPVSFSF